VLAHYEALAEESGQTQELRKGVADAHLRVGNIRDKLGQYAEAEAALRRAQEHWARLVADWPGVPAHLDGLAGSRDMLGNVLMKMGRPKLAEAAYRDALEIQKRLAADFPAVPQFRQDLAMSHNNLGVVLRETGRPKDVEAAHRDALEIQKRLAADFPAVPQYRRELAQSHINLGVLLRDTGRPKLAEAAYRDALEILKRLTAVFPAVPDFRMDLVKCHNNLAVLLMETGRPQDAEVALRNALEAGKRLAADFPVVPQYQARVANTMDGLAEIAIGRKDYAAARQLLDEARPHLQAALDSNPRNPFFRLVSREIHRDLATALLGLGDHAGAARAAAELAHVAYEPANDAYKAACFFSGCISLAQKDAKLPEARRKELAQSYGDRAVQTLRQAIANGYKDAANLKKDKDLDPLRQRDDFTKLLAELDKAVGQDKAKDNRPQK
jgi:tetratricopeptide (TPR) repeat protein